MPCTSVFDRQDAAYRERVLPRGLPRVAVEAGVTDYWRKGVGAADSGHGAVVGIDRSGESAPGPELFAFRVHRRERRGSEAHPLVAVLFRSNR